MPMKKTPPFTERRKFFEKIAAIGTGSASPTEEKIFLSHSPKKQRDYISQLDPSVKVIHTSCLGCNARCGMRAVVKNGKLEHVSGNPFHPYNHNFDPLPYDTPVTETLGCSSPVCAKAKDACSFLYSPYRIVKPLKRSGARGSGKFEPIEWGQLIQEIAEGGTLFSALDDQKNYPGLKKYLSDELIDSKAPELGTVRNQLIFLGGRDQAGYQDFSARFVRDAFGSVNRIGHTDICGLGFRMGNYALTEQVEVELKADPYSAEYIMVVGANVYEALQPGINTYGSLLAKRQAEGLLKFVVIDPRATNASAHAHRWLAVKPGQDNALIMGMIHHILQNHRFNADYLMTPYLQAAKDKGFGCYSNATHLIITDEQHPNYGKFLRWKDLFADQTAEKADSFIVLTLDGVPVDFEEISQAKLDVATILTTADGQQITVKTAFTLMKEGVMQHTLEKYASLCGIEEATIAVVAEEFCSYGVKAAVCQYHGAGNYSNGTYAAYAIAILNALVGSVNLKGGYLKGGGGSGAWNEGLYDLKQFPRMYKASGVKISRENAIYENSSEFQRKRAQGESGYPAKRPWFSYTRGGLCVEAMSGIADQYPYACGVLFTFFFNPVYSIPGGECYREVLKDTDRVPLHISVDIGINESNLYADYIIPDVTYLEGRYAFLTPHAPGMKFTAVRTPVVEPLTGKTMGGQAICLETLLIDLAKQLHLPGFGEQAIPVASGGFTPLHTPEDYYLRGIANLADKANLPSNDKPSIHFVEKSYPIARYKSCLSEIQWQQTCYLLARGGVFNHRYDEDFEMSGAHKYGISRVVLYNEQLASARNALTGESYSGTLKLYEPADSKGYLIAEEDHDFPLLLVTHKMNVHAQSRSIWHALSMQVFPQNDLWIHPDDAASLDIAEKEKVHIFSRSNPQGVIAQAHLSRLVRKGCVSLSFHYGHTQLGASSLPIQRAEEVFLGGKAVTDSNGLVGNPKLLAGTSPNKLSRLDTHLNNMPLVDILSGIPDFSSTRIRIEKIGIV